MDSDFKPRIVIGIIGGIAILLCNFFYPEPLYFILAIFWCFSFIEITNLLDFTQKERDWFLLTSAYLFILSFYVLEIGSNANSFSWILYLSLIWLIAILIVMLNNPIRGVFRILSYSIYLTLPYVFLIFLRKQYGSKIFLLLLLIVWSMDVFSYFCGKLFGRHLIAPKISPKKTWEGTLFGILVACFMLVFGFNAIGIKTNPLICFAGILLPIIGFLGDLFESVIKRRSLRKDSGSLLHGHGGFLDRFDSLLFVSIAFSILIYFL